MTLRENFIDHGDVGSLLRVRLGKIAPRQKRNAHRFEVARRDDSILGYRLRLLRHRRAPFNGEVVVGVAFPPWQFRNPAHRYDARPGPPPFPKLSISRYDAPLLPGFTS